MNVEFSGSLCAGSPPSRLGSDTCTVSPFCCSLRGGKRGQERGAFESDMLSFSFLRAAFVACFRERAPDAGVSLRRGPAAHEDFDVRLRHPGLRLPTRLAAKGKKKTKRTRTRETFRCTPCFLFPESPSFPLASCTSARVRPSGTVLELCGTCAGATFAGRRWRVSLPPQRKRSSTARKQAGAQYKRN